MTAKEYLQQIRVLDVKIKQLEEQIIRLKSLAMSPKGMSINNNPGGKKSVVNEEDRLNKLVIEYITLEQQAESKKKELEKIRNEIVAKIQQLEDYRYIDVLYKRYVKCESYERIAKEMNYSIPNVTKLLSLALTQLETLL